MKKNNKERLYEVMCKLDPSVKSKINEVYYDETSVFNKIKNEFGVPDGGDIRINDVGREDYIVIYYYGDNEEAREWVEKIKNKFGENTFNIKFVNTRKI